MTGYITYQFDQNGFIGATNRSDWPDDHEFLKTANFVVATDPIPATLTTTHANGVKETIDTVVQAGWSFQLDENGVPVVGEDGHYIVTPPPHHVPDPTVLTHIFSMLAELTKRDPSTFDTKTLNEVNWSLAKSGLQPVAGTQLIDTPIKEAKIISSDAVVKILGVHSSKGNSKAV